MKSTNTWTKAAIPAVLLVLHNANRLAPVPLFEELRVHFGTDYVGVGNIFGAYLLTYALFNIPAGMLADKMNNKSLSGVRICQELFRRRFLQDGAGDRWSSHLCPHGALRCHLVSAGEEGSRDGFRRGGGRNRDDYVTLPLALVCKRVRPHKSIPHAAGSLRSRSRRDALRVAVGANPWSPIGTVKSPCPGRKPVLLVSRHLLFLRHACPLFCHGMASNLSQN
jgi:hypothetical protein